MTLSETAAAVVLDKALLTDGVKATLNEDIKAKLSELLEVECDNVLSVSSIATPDIMHNLTPGVRPGHDRERQDRAGDERIA